MIGSEESSNIARTTSPEKQPSLLSLLILTTLTITLYSFGIHQSGKTVMGIVEAVVKEVVRDY
jgi:hypothetical protein